MWNVIKNLWLGLVLIIVASAVLLLSDLGRREKNASRPNRHGARSLPGSQDGTTVSEGNARIYRVGVITFGPDPVFEMAVKGVREGLAAAGFQEGVNLELQEVQAQNDISLLHQLVQELVSRQPDLLIPLSTPCLASVLTNGHGIPTVFGIVTSPLEAGAGESFEKHLPHVTGAAWSAPLPELLEWMARLFPGRRTLGISYNPSHANSLAEVAAIRDFCDKQGWKCVERPVSSSSEIKEGMQSLLQAKPDLVFAIGDNTLVSAKSAVADICAKAKIPLVAVDGSLMGDGALFSIGASPRLEGRRTGALAARVLLGADSADIPFTPSVDKETTLDFAAARRLGITFPEELLQQVDRCLHLRALRDRPAMIAMVNLVQARSLELAENGFKRGLIEAGLVDGEDFILRKFNAQGEITQLPALLDAAVNLQPDLIVTITTPAMVAAASRVKDFPIVFCVGSDPLALKIFTKETIPSNLTGVYDDPALGALLQMAMDHNPELKSVGIIYDPSQPNSMLSVERLRRACTEKNVPLHEATAASMIDLSTAVQSLIQQDIGALIVSTDNLVTAGFAAVHKLTSRAGIPIFATETDLLREGAIGAIGEDFELWGAHSAQLAVKVLAGVPPAALPLEPTRVRRTNPPGHSPVASRQSAVTTGTPYKISIIRYNDAIFTENVMNGVIHGFDTAGWKEGKDYQLKIFNAQGDIVTLSSIMAACRADRPDLLIPISTPALQGALRQSDGIPMVYGCVASGVQAGAGKTPDDHLPNVTGVDTLAPCDAMARLIRETFPDARAVGTLYSPGEVNAEFNRAVFMEALQKAGLKLVSVPISSTAATAEAANAMLRADIQLVCQIMDNSARPGFAQIAKRAAQAGLPFICFDSSALNEGAIMSMGRNYFDSGIETAALAMRVLGGENPGTIPFFRSQSEELIVNAEALAKSGIVLPEEWQQKAKIWTGKANEN